MKKISKNWYQIPVAKDKWGITTYAVAVLRTEHNEWSVCDGEVEIAGKPADMRRYVFIKLRAAKAFARDMAEAISNEISYPTISDQKYLDLD